MTEKTDHDLLIEVVTKLDLFYDMYERHLKDDTSVQAMLTRDIKAAHRRMDYFMVGGVLVIIGFIVTIWLK